MAETTVEKVGRLFKVLDLLDSDACAEVLFNLCGALDENEQFAEKLQQILIAKFFAEYNRIPDE